MIGRMRDFLRLASRNLRRNRRRNLSTGIAISLGFIGLLVLGAYLFRVQNYLRVYSIYASQIGHVVIYKKDGYEKFNSEPKKYSISSAQLAMLQAQFAKDPSIERVGTKLFGSGLVGNGCRSTPFIATGVETAVDSWVREHPEMKYWASNISNLKAGAPLSKYSSDLSPIGISTGLAFLLSKPRVHDEIPDSKSINIVHCDQESAMSDQEKDANVQLAVTTWNGMFTAKDGEIVNHFTTGLSDTENSAVYMNILDLQKLLDTDAVTSVSIWLKDPRELDSFLANLQKTLPQDLEAFPWHSDAINPYYHGTIEFLKTMISFIAAVLLTIIAFSIVNSVTMTVLERAQEVGMMRSLGFSRGAIVRVFIAEVGILCGLAVLAGFVIALVVMWSINGLDIRFNPPGISGGMQLKLIPDPFLIACTTGLVLVLGIFTTWATVRRASRAKIPILLSAYQR